MSFITRLLIKILSLLYLAMAIIGILGYLRIWAFQTNIFSFCLSFGTIFTCNSHCLLFTIICWQISRKPKYEFVDDDEMEDETENIGRKAVPKSQKRNKRDYPSVATQPSRDGFSAYFSGQTLITDRQVSSDKLKVLGTNYATYFGQGERNIYLPVKTVRINV